MVERRNRHAKLARSANRVGHSRCQSDLNRATLLLAQSLTQSDTGVIRGVVLDPQGAVIPGAEVRATNNQTAQAFTTKSDDTGAFVLIGVPFGDYSLLITSPGFAKFHTPVTLSRETSEAPHNATMQVTLGEVRIDAHMIDIGSTTTVCVVCSYTLLLDTLHGSPFSRPRSTAAGDASVGSRRTQRKLLDRRPPS